MKTVDQIAMDLERDFDTSKPVIFTGNYDIPYSIVQDAYVSYSSPVYYKMKRLADLVDRICWINTIVDQRSVGGTDTGIVCYRLGTLCL